MKPFLLTFVGALGVAAPAQERALEAAAVLDDFHRAAAEADAERYFGHMTVDGVFLGTDAGERWTVEEFRAYATPYFSKGIGWTYVASERHIGLAPERTVAWFDERLQNAKYGEVRGSGALVLQNGAWKIAQYNLSFPVPNADAAALTKKVIEAETLGVPAGQAFEAEDGERKLSIWNKVIPGRLELPREERPVVVLLPSATFSARALWDFPRGDYSVMESLARRGFDVFAIDLGGYGASSAPQDNPQGGALSACRDLGIALDRIDELRGAGRVVLVGPSWGAQVAGRFAADHPERVRGVVLYGFTWKQRFPESAMREIFGQGVFEAPTRACTIESVLADFHNDAHEAGIPQAFAEHVVALGARVPTGPLRDFTFELPLVDPKRLTMPTLMMTGRMEFALRDEDSSGQDSWANEKPDDEARGDEARGDEARGDEARGDESTRDESTPGARIHTEHLADAQAFYSELPTLRHWIEIPGGGHLVHMEQPHALFQRCLASWIERLPK